MLSKVRNVVIFAAGYVLGAQAGRARYEELKRQAMRVVEHPKTQAVTDRTRQFVAGRLPSGVIRRPGSTSSASPQPSGPEVPVTEPVVAAVTTPEGAGGVPGR